MYQFHFGRDAVLEFDSFDAALACFRGFDAADSDRMGHSGRITNTEGELTADETERLKGSGLDILEAT